MSDFFDGNEIQDYKSTKTTLEGCQLRKEFTTNPPLTNNERHGFKCCLVPI